MAGYQGFSGAGIASLPDTTATFNAPLQTVSGTVTNAGSPVAGLTVLLLAGGVPVASTISASDGTWSIAPSGIVNGATLRAVILPSPGGSTTAITVPAQMAAPTFGAITMTSIVVNWTAPTSGGAPTDYYLQYKRSVDSTWTTIDTAGIALTATVSGLISGTSYDFRVAGVDAAGTGTYSLTATTSTSSSGSYFSAQTLPLVA